jgi:ketosteroid isomerase-like protein
MTRFLMKALLVLSCGMLVTSTARAADMAAQKKAEAEVRQAVHDIVTAYATTDVDKYFSYYADDMSICCSGGEWWSKQAYYKLWKDLTAQGGGQKAAAVKDLRVQVSANGDAAIATYLMPCVRRKVAEGQSAEITYNMTDVWMRNPAGQWKVQNVTFSTAKADAKGPATKLASPD